MDAERDQVAPSGEERSADARRSDGDALGSLAPRLNRGLGAPRRGWAPADVRALQRTAGNAVVARLLANVSGSTAPVKGAARGVIQRELAWKPDDIETKAGPIEDRPKLVELKEALEAYWATGKSEERYSRLKEMLLKVEAWRGAYEKNTSKKAGSAESTRLNHKLGRFKETIESELPEAKLYSKYMKHMRVGKFEYTSFESEGELRETEKLMRGETGNALRGMGPEALKVVREAGLTEAETAAVKVYAVGDFRAINATLGGWVDSRLTTALHEMGLVKDEGGSPVLPAETFAPKDPLEVQSWKDRGKRFAKYVPFFKPDLSKVRAEARRHAEILDRAFRKLPAFDTSREGMKTWRGVRLDPTWSDYDTFTTEGSVYTAQNYVSTSKNRGEAEKFALKKGPDGRKGLVLECTLKNGRDISMLAHHGKEKEVLVLPGAHLKVDKVIRMQPSLPYDFLVRVTEL